jgi:hypothetical protein
MRRDQSKRGAGVRPERRIRDAVAIVAFMLGIRAACRSA